LTDRPRPAVLVDGITEDAVTGGAIGLPCSVELEIDFLLACAGARVCDSVRAIERSSFVVAIFAPLRW